MTAPYNNEIDVKSLALVHGKHVLEVYEDNAPFTAKCFWRDLYSGAACLSAAAEELQDKVDLSGVVGEEPPKMGLQEEPLEKVGSEPAVKVGWEALQEDPPKKVASEPTAKVGYEVLQEELPKKVAFEPVEKVGWEVLQYEPPTKVGYEVGLPMA
ncbi:hypothetical protein E2562_012826 [Oryza meyeriana var. granulata]|uniref:Uncharacterized protein n=1 Tax=Oryza meyeriana var. granulata TaxID=110450 RepID=A0A6G1CQE3_9ORYZ|nr:hypothetical protein E2562_012826 [Oryza meyeriana var. granulata]